MSSDITKISQAYNTSQEKTGKLKENAISQALTKAQNINTQANPIDTINFETNCARPHHETSLTSTWPTYNYNMPQQPEINIHQVYRPYEDHTPPQTHTNQLCPYQNSLDLNQSVVELFRHQTELTHSTQCLHQQTTDALSSIATSSSHQENLHFINDMSIFKAKDPQSFGDWLEQIDKSSIINKQRSIQTCSHKISRLI